MEAIRTQYSQVFTPMLGNVYPRVYPTLKTKTANKTKTATYGRDLFFKVKREMSKVSHLYYFRYTVLLYIFQT